MANGVEVVMEPPPWLPPGIMNGGGIKEALNFVADIVSRGKGISTALGHAYTWETTSSAGGWPSEATVMIAFMGVDTDALSNEFGDGDPELAHAIARHFGI
jgi:hypothetical protein